MPEKTSLVWAGPSGIAIPASANSPKEIIPFAGGLRTVDQERVIVAFENELYDMGAEFVWRRAMTRLRQTLAALGMTFVGEILGRDDLDDRSNPDVVLTDHDTIRLAEALGIVGETGALKLRHALELLIHFSHSRDDEELTLNDAVTVVRSCVQYALGDRNIQVAVDFSKFRERLSSTTLDASDPQIELLATQPPFFLSTALRVLIAAIKIEKGARLQHALSNATTVLPVIWDRLPETDRWSIGSAYSEATAAGRETVVADLKRALVKVNGFDYVPENLRSQTYKKAAQAVIDAHFSFNNFYNEVPPMRFLASLGTVIPKPAVPECVRALLLVYLGNSYGISYSAAAIAEPELMRLTVPMWEYFWSVVLQSDEEVLATLTSAKPAARLVQLLKIKPIGDLKAKPGVIRLLRAAKEERPESVQAEAMKLLADFKSSKR